MKLLKLASMLSLLSMDTLISNHPLNLSQRNTPRPRPTEDELAINKGLTKFFYGDNYVWARNEKNADRKAKNKGYIK